MPTLQDQLAPVIAAAPEVAKVMVYAEHLETGETAAFAADTVTKSASTIKVAIMAALARAVDAGTLDLETKVPVREADIVPGSGVVRFMERDLALSLNDHCYLMIAVSDNTTSNILVDQVGLEAVQAICREFAGEGTMLGRKFFGRAAQGKEVENTVTARGLATLLRHIVTGNVASPERTAWMKEMLGRQQYKNRLGRSLGWDETPWYGGKTGLIEGYTHDCGVFQGPGGTITCAALTEHPHDIYLMEPWMGEVGRVLADRVR